jgi:hypothetical protein
MPVYGGATRGAAKAWIQFDGTGTPAARASFGVSSITDNGTGDYTFNWTAAFATANYCVVATACANYGVRFGGAVQLFTNSTTEVAPTTTAARLNFCDSSGAFLDVKYGCVAAFGD